jgi:hypothetical protein
MLARQFMCALCALGFLCASSGLVSAQSQKKGTGTTHMKSKKQKGVAGALRKEPPAYSLSRGQTYLVDDGSCPRGQIKQIVGNLPLRIRRCVPR